MAGLAAGLVFSLQMLGLNLEGTLLEPDRTRSLHISLMLYGFFPLVLSLLPFALFEKEGLLSQRSLEHLRRYFWVWNTFLLFMVMALLFGNTRGLPFYDFPYQFNFILAFSGIFYVLALIDTLKRYERRPLWVNVSLGVVIIAPVLLVFLMNPQYGQVEKSLIGPHGDNTLGMSFALIPLYYLLIKLHAPSEFSLRWNGLWILPLAGYVISLAIRNFIHPLSYAEEWFFQYLTLLYLPLLWRWWKDSGLRFNDSPYLLISIGAFAFVDLEGNLLFIPQIRELIHRNDMVIGHAHIAMGIAVAFMAFSILHRYLPSLISRSCALGWSFLVTFMALSLSIAGMIEAGWLNWNIELFLSLRSIGGAILIVMVGMIVWKLLKPLSLSRLELYHWIGFGSDFGGGIFLLFGAGILFPLLGNPFEGGYGYVVFAFMMGTGLVHWVGTRMEAELLGSLSANIRLIVASVFAALYMTHELGNIALLVALYDGFYGALYWLWLRGDRQR